MKHHFQRIAFYVTDLDPSHGGMERVTYLLASELDYRGYDIYAIHTNDKPIDKSLYLHYRDLCQGDSTRQSDVPGIIAFIKKNNIELVINQCYTCYSSIELQKAIKKETSAVLINAFHTTPFLLKHLKEFHRSLPIPQFSNRILFSIHKTVNLKPRYRKGNRLSYELCDAFVMLSPYYLSEFANDNKIKNISKLYAIANPCDSVSYNSNVPKEKIILVVARLNNQQKRIDRTLQFWKKFHQNEDGWKLMIVGDGADKKMLERMAEKLGLSDYSFEGHSDTPMDYYTRAMIFMMTSDAEGWGMTLVEAMSMGCVPVAMNCFSALPDIVTDKQNGMIVPKDDISGMVTAAQYIIAHFNEMSAQARESVKRFDVKTIINKWEELFNRL